MANDRYYLECHKCKSTVIFARVWGYHLDLIDEKLEDWLMEHTTVCGNNFTFLNESDYCAKKKKE